jgi:hypothetical protein
VSLKVTAQRLTRHSGRHRQEMRAILPLHLTQFREAQVHLMDEGRRPDGEIAFPAQLPHGNGVNIAIQMGQQLVVGLLFAL